MWSSRMWKRELSPTSELSSRHSSHMGVSWWVMRFVSSCGGISQQYIQYIHLITKVYTIYSFNYLPTVRDVKMFLTGHKCPLTPAKYCALRLASDTMAADGAIWSDS